jgi:hypothetical protein
MEDARWRMGGGHIAGAGSAARGERRGTARPRQALGQARLGNTHCGAGEKAVLDVFILTDRPLTLHQMTTGIQTQLGGRIGYSSAKSCL